MGGKGSGRKTKNDPALMLAAGVDPGKRGRKYLERKAAEKAKKAEIVETPAVVPISMDAQHADVPRLPDFVCAEGIEVWNDIIPKLVASGAVRNVDSYMLGMYCHELGKAIKYERILAKKKQPYIRHGGYNVPLPEVKLARDAQAAATKIYKDMKLDPGSRRAMGTDTPQPQQPPAAQTQQDDPKRARLEAITKPKAIAVR